MKGRVQPCWFTFYRWRAGYSHAGSLFTAGGPGTAKLVHSLPMEGRVQPCWFTLYRWRAGYSPAGSLFTNGGPGTAMLVHSLPIEGRVQPCWFTLYQWRADNGWLVTYRIICHMSAMSIASLIPKIVSLLIQTAGHKTAELTVVF